MSTDGLRPAHPGDIDALAALHVASWKAAYRGLLPDEYLDRLAPDDRIPVWERRLAEGQSSTFTLVSVLRSQLVGFGVGTVDASDDADRGTVEALYVSPSQWRHGVGLALLAAVEAGLGERGCSSADLWVLDGNTRAMAFYEAQGWTNLETVRSVSLFGIQALEHRFGRNLR
jgi:GNAT superfamily N-acetyltransferase